jgi:hypothetical protein
VDLSDDAAQQLMPVGCERDAQEALLRHTAGNYGLGAGATPIGSGEDRTAYLVNGIVYKIGTRRSANRYDHETLSDARAAGLRWAPESSLYELVDQYGDEWPVMAMPYLVADGTDPDPDLLAEMNAQTGGEVDWTNYVVLAGQPIVIDGCTVSKCW